MVQGSPPPGPQLLRGGAVEVEPLDVSRFRVEVDQDRPFPAKGTKFWLWLTREEWRAAFAGSFAEQMTDQLDPKIPKDWAMQIWIADRHLENGYDWQGIAVRDDGRLVPKTAKPIEMGNFVLVRKFYFMEQVLPILLEEQGLDIELVEILSRTMGKGESALSWFYEEHVEAAIPWLEENIPGYDVSPLRHALEQIEIDRMKIGGPMPPHIRREIERMMERFGNKVELVN